MQITCLKCDYQWESHRSPSRCSKCKCRRLKFTESPDQKKTYAPVTATAVENTPQTPLQPEAIQAAIRRLEKNDYPEPHPVAPKPTYPPSSGKNQYAGSMPALPSAKKGVAFQNEKLETMSREYRESHGFKICPHGIYSHLCVTCLGQRETDQWRKKNHVTLLPCPHGKSKPECKECTRG